jgi:hypothetical protein
MRSTGTTAVLALALAAGGLALAPPARADHGGLTVTGLTQNHRLVTFKASAPGTVLSSVKVTGLEAGDTLQAIDFRPATGGLYGVATSDAGAKLYLIDAATGAASRVGTAVYAVAGEVSIDFNPTVDRLRVVSSDRTNLRVNPNNGALAATDTSLSYASGTGTPAVGAVAYTNNDNDCLNVAPATSCTTPSGSTGTGTTLFDIDAATDALVTQVPPNNGTLNLVGALPQAAEEARVGFDVYTRTTNGVNWAFATICSAGTTTFWELDLTTGGAKTTSPVPGSGKAVGGNPAVIDIALATAQAGF